MTVIVDYGAGNLFSLQSSLKHIGCEAVVSKNPDEILKAKRVIVPGVGAFSDAIAAIRLNKLDQAVISQANAGRPVMGICLGMQLLFEGSLENGRHTGLGLLPGMVEFIGGPGFDASCKIPHMGWNNLVVVKTHPLLKYFNDGDWVYYVHSYYSPVGDWTAASTSYGETVITGVAAADNVCGCQFHPEKSGAAGLNILRAFMEMR